jgi:TRAP-type C4-dicarboxylate transport system permease small subunit
MFERATRALAYGLALVAGVVLVLMMVQTAADVISSNFFGRPIENNLEIISTYYMVMVVFLPLAFVELRHEHISVDLAIRTMPPPLQRAVLVFGYLVCTAFFAILAFQTWEDAVNSWRINEIMMGAAYLTIWPAKFALPIGFLAIALATALHAWKASVDRNFAPVPGDPGLPGEGA